MISFEKASYRAQIARSRRLAEETLKDYSIGPHRIDFINHGENTTFRVTARKQTYLLRLHRFGYHKKAAILEELNWIRKIAASTDIPVQVPIQTKRGQLVAEYEVNGCPPRFCDLLTWQDGIFRYKSVKQTALYSLGQLTGKLHASSKGLKVKHRAYWTSEELLGRNAKFGSLSQLAPLFPKEYPILNEARKKTIGKIRLYERKFPNRISLIHADLHFGNIVWNKNQITPIDFDDCGLGFHAYDIAVSMLASHSILNRFNKVKRQKLIDSYFDGYASKHELTQSDREIIPYFMNARNLLMKVWCWERRDNPRIIGYLKTSMKRDLPKLRKFLKHGPDSF